MPKEPQISFIVPVYRKSPEVFDKCLRSLFDQSLKEVEVICVFDGPDEALQAIVKKYPRVKEIVVEHGGASKARNAGLDIAAGEYVVCWDADCFIKPDTAKRWLEEFEATGADFVYTGYEVQNEGGGFESEPFNAYSLTSGNYISTMSPIKREKAPRFDENLKAGQDWDFFWTAVENGCKGAWIEGSGFVTDKSGEAIDRSIGLASNNRLNIINQIREKHGVTGRTTGVMTMRHRDRALRIAKILGADFMKATGLEPSAYKTIINIGYNFMSRFDGIASDVTKIQYWFPDEIEALGMSRYNTVIETVKIAKTVKNLCGTHYEKNKLGEIGIEAEVVPLPLDDEEIKSLETTLPDEFSVLVITDKNYGKLLQELQQDLPHIKFGYQLGQTKDYSALLSFYSFAPLDFPILSAHVNGRHVISNVQAPFCGFVDPAQEWETFKRELYQKIREVRGKPFNREARDYYLHLADPEKFRQKIAVYTSPKLEVIPA